jgi:hypothetical protein
MLNSPASMPAHLLQRLIWQQAQPTAVSMYPSSLSQVPHFDPEVMLLLVWMPLSRPGATSFVPAYTPILSVDFGDVLNSNF